MIHRSTSITRRGRSPLASSSLWFTTQNYFSTGSRRSLFSSSHNIRPLALQQPSSSLFITNKLNNTNYYRHFVRTFVITSILQNPTVIMSDANKLESSLQGLPVKSLVPTGQCQFTDEATAVPLIGKFAVSKTTSVLRFGVPKTDEPLNLSTCACLLAIAEINGETVVRPYTPISTNAAIGYFDLLVKNYGPTAKMSHFLCDILEPNQEFVSFKHIPFNVKIQAPFPFKTIGMIVGGTGITPMIQALHAILGEETPSTKVVMLYGSRVSTDILGKEILDEWTSKYPDHLQVIHVLSHEPEDSDWTGPRGFITPELIEQSFPAPTAEDPFNIFICGPPPMYDFFSGPRTEKEVTGLLGKLGYNADQVYKF